MNRQRRWWWWGATAATASGFCLAAVGTIVLRKRAAKSSQPQNGRAKVHSRAELETIALAAAERLQSAILKVPTATAHPAPFLAVPQITVENVPGVPQPRVIGAGVVPLPREAVIERLFIAGEKRALWNRAWRKTTLLDSWTGRGGRKFALFHECIAGALGGAISGRDFVEVRVAWHDKSQATSWIAFASVDDGRAPPSGSSSAYKRATAITSGSMARDINGHPGHALVHSLVHVSPGMGLPGWIIAKAVAAELRSFFSGVSAVFGNTTPK